MASRDFLVVPNVQDDIVITCDSIGGIGGLSADFLKVEPSVVGHFLARVALMELLAAGAELVALSCTFTINELDAAPILEGVFAEARHVHPSPERITVVTTEKNIPTIQTGVGITCIGNAKGGVRSGLSQPGDVVLAIGVPKVGAEVKLIDPEALDIPLLMRLLAHPGVRDVAPAGSKGILYEAEAIAEGAKLRLHCLNDSPILYKSAGPATATTFSCDPDAVTAIKNTFNNLIAIGILKEDNNT
ncbi:MAG: hypothetical protein FD169_1655 [Bacillota bacterium]|nr:MAG: hypothetical protein FD169_1655 [Bacillota bacterium]MBS3950350.1 alpha-ribazole kinase [Peptococcaceae bacterium]